LLYVIGGRPSQGKSALGLNIAAHVSIKERRPVGFLSLESSTTELLGRLVASSANVNSRNLASGFFSGTDMAGIHKAGELLYAAPLWIWDQPNAKLADTVSTARFMRRQHKVELLVIDYLQLIGVPGAVDRRDSVAQSSMAMKQLARELEIPVVILAQLNRDSDNRRPEMGDFQWSSQIEQDADVGIMLYHKMSGPDEDRTIDKSWLFVEKCRDGKRGSVPVCFRQEYVRFEDGGDR
jgi:replicative DNA helicase